MNLAHLVAGLLLAQTTPPTSPSATTSAPDALLVPGLALKRWYGSATLSSPTATPSHLAIWAWVVGIGALLFLAILAQGPQKALGQFLNLAGLTRLLSAAVGRLRKSARLVAILLGATVVSWTAWQTPLHNAQDKKEELALLLKAKSRAEFATEQGSLAALTPLRDMFNMGDMFVLLVGAAALTFKFSADRWGRTNSASSTGGWTTVAWGSAGLYAMYRLASLIKEIEGFPPFGGCIFLEIGAVPLLMVLADGLLLAWVLVELRGSDFRDDESGFDVAGTISIMPAAVLACLVGLPARYVATAVGLAVFQEHLPKFLAGSPWLWVFLRGWGLMWLQAGSLAFLGLAGSVPWSNGSWWSTSKGYGRILKSDGGQLAALVAVVGLGVGATSGLAYFAVLAMPTQSWVLLAADSYAHYASLPIGLIGLAAMVELGSRTAQPITLKPRVRDQDVMYVGPTEV